MGRGSTNLPQDALGYPIQATFPFKSTVLSSTATNQQHTFNADCKAVRLYNKDTTNPILITFGSDPNASTGAKYSGDPDPCVLEFPPGTIEIFGIKPGSRLGYVRSGGVGTEADLEVVELGNQDSGSG